MDESLVSEKLNRIDDAVTRIRTKTDTSDSLIEDVASAVEAFVIPEGTLNITENGVYDVTSYVSTDVAIPLPSGSISITENGQYDVTSYVNASVLVGQTIDWTQIGYARDPQELTDAFDHAKSIYDNWDASQTSLLRKFNNDLDLVFMPYVDTSNVISFYYTFAGCSRLITVPLINTSAGQTFFGMFYDCSGLKSVPLLNTSAGTNFNSMFHGCSSLSTIPLIDTSNSTDISSMFSGCSNLQYVPQLDTSSATAMHSMFYNCTSLFSIPQLEASKITNIGSDAFHYCAKLTTFGGLNNIGQAYTLNQANYSYYTLDFSTCTLLSHDSLMNIINKLYDLTIDDKPTQKLILGTNNKDKLTLEEIAIATTKGWTVY